MGLPTPAGDGPSTQTERRFDLIHLEPFRYNTLQHIAVRVAHLTGLEHQLRLLKATPGMLTEGTMPEYLFRRTAGWSARWNGWRRTAAPRPSTTRSRR